MNEPLDRRAFGKLSGAALGGAVAAGTLLAGQPAAKPEGQSAAKLAGRIKKAVGYQMIQGNLSPTDKFKLLADLGFDGVEGHLRQAGEAKAIAKARDATGLPIHCISGARPENIAEVLELARLWGSDSILVVPGRVSEKVSYDENYATSREGIRKAIPLAEKQGVRLLVENVWNNFLLSPMEAARYIDEFSSDTVGAYFDVGNVVRFGWPEQWIRILGKRIGRIHIKEYSRKIQRNEGLMKGFQVEIGEGDCGWPAVCQALLEIDYRGWATAEVRGGDQERLAEIAQRMDQVLGLE